MKRWESVLNQLPDSVKQYGTLVLLGIIGIFLGFNLHATLVYAGFWLVQHPQIARLGWNSFTISAWSRLLFFSLGCTWLFWVALLDQVVRRWISSGRWLRRTLQSLLAMLLLYLLDNLLVLVLSR